MDIVQEPLPAIASPPDNTASQTISVPSTTSGLSVSLVYVDPGFTGLYSNLTGITRLWTTAFTQPVSTVPITCTLGGWSDGNERFSRMAEWPLVRDTEENFIAMPTGILPLPPVFCITGTSVQEVAANLMDQIRGFLRDQDGTMMFTPRRHCEM